MLRILKLSALVSVVILCFLSLTAVSHGQSINNGDVNGDSNQDIGDVIYMLSHLFQSGPPPVPIPILVEPLTPAISDSRFVINGDGTITDLETRLVWITGDYYNYGTDPSFQFADNYFNAIGFAGANNWRIPKLHEIMSTVPWGVTIEQTNTLFGRVFNDSEVMSLNPIWVGWQNLVLSFGGDSLWTYIDNPNTCLLNGVEYDCRMEWYLVWPDGAGTIGWSYGISLPSSCCPFPFRTSGIAVRSLQ